MSKNKGPNTGEAVAAKPVAQPEPTNPAGAADGQDNSDDLYLAAERELRGESAEPEQESEPVQPEQPESEPEPEPVAAEPVAAKPSRTKIDPNAEYVFDDNGNEIVVKGSDAAWLTPHMHRKLQEKHAELEKYKPLEQRFQHDRGGLARDILLAANPAERLAAVKELLKQDGLTDLSSAIEQRMAQANLSYDPLQAQRAMIQQQQQELEQRRVQFESQQRLMTEVSALETQIGRKLTPRETAGIDAVYGNWMQARQANPSLPLPPVSQAYKLAVEAIRFEEAARPQPKPKTPTPAERSAQGNAKTGPASPDDLFIAAMREQNIAI